MSRFGIALGFTIGQACKDNEVDINTFFAVVNFLIDEERGSEPVNIASLSV